ncbi:MAG: amidohydrolase [Bacteroidota bacterium]|jgi:predicted amidohydrolase YtcJ
MKKGIVHLLVLTVLISCSKSRKIQADKIVYNAVVHIMDSTQKPHECIVIKDGLIQMTGSYTDAKAQYITDTLIDMQGSHIYPGWHDAHAHFWGYGISLQQVDLSSCNTWQEVIERCKAFYEKYKPEVLLGRGWDQNRWGNVFPDNQLLNEHFSHIPVLLKRIDGHAAVANAYLLNLAGINSQTKIQGGDVLLKSNRPTGVLIDNAVDLAAAKLPKYSNATHVKALLAAQDTCFSYGITALTDAGLPTELLLLIDSLHACGLLKLRINGMVSIDSTAVSYWLKRGVYTTDKLRIGSFKMYADGALGSRGACLLNKYHDANHHGMIITEANTMKGFVERIASSSFQLNTHCIGDSANRLLLKLYSENLTKANDRRWRIEHAQVMNPDDYVFYKTHAIIPSVQPTHATSDMYWAANRLGKERIVHAYAYQVLLQQNGWLPLGTDFPVEHVNPMLTYIAATQRKDAKGYPEGGFQPENKLTHWQALYGMTTWAAKAAFMEHNTGNLKQNYFADFVVYKKDISRLSLSQLFQLKPEATYVNGIKVY